MKTTFSRRELYAFGEPIGDSATVKKIGGGRIYGMGGGGGGGGPTQTNVQNTNVPEYARPYVETMLGATQNQLFNTTQVAAEGDTPGYTRIDSFKPYQAYGGTYDDKGKQLSYDPSKSIAGFSPAQIAAQQGIAGQYDPVTGKLALDAKGKPINAGLQLPSEFGDASAGIMSAMGAKNAYTAPANLGYTATDAAASRAEAAKLGLAPTATAAQSTYAPTLQQYQMGGPEKVATKSFTDAGTAAKYMSPYRENVLDLQNKALERQASIDKEKRGAQAARSGAFGGSRQGIENAEAQRNLAMLKNTNTAQGLQESYAQAMQQFNAEQGYGLQGQIANQQAGLTVGQQNLGANLGVQQLGTQTGTQMALANLSNEQQAALANQALKGQYGLTQGQFDQGANMQTSAQAQQTALANAAAKNAAAQFTSGQNLISAQTAAQYGLAADQLKLQASGQLGALGGQELAAQQGILGLQNQVGAQQQALEQQIKNQAVQDYANAQQYPLMQLGTMSNMLRGLPMQASSTQQYQAAPSPVSQFVGAAGAAGSLYNAFKPGPGGAAGGLPSEFKYAKGGGIMSYDMGGEVESQLESMDEQGLAEQAKESSSPSIRKMAQRILRERQMSKQPQGTGPMGVQYQAAQAPMPSLRGGGIIAFQQGAGGNGSKSAIEEGGDEEAKVGMQERLAMPPTSGQTLQQRVMQGKPTGDVTDQPRGIIQAAPAAAAPPKPLADVVAEATRQRDIYSTQANRSTEDVIKEIQAERDASGVGDNKAREQYRAQQMAERANTKDEQERQRYMRMAEFFASWGSTPGPTLVAGMNALKQSIPGIISDEKEAKKARKEADKIIYEIDEATRLDKLGMHTEATARREKAAGHAQDFNKQLLTFQAQIESNKKALEVAEIQAKSSKYVADTQAKSQSGYNAQRAKEAEFRNIEVSLNAALRQKADIEKDIEATRSKPPKGSPLAKAMDTANLYNSLLSKNNGDASKLDAITRKNGEQALETINKFETNAARRLREAENRVQTFENLFDTAGRGSKSGAKTSKSKDDPYDIMDILKEEPPASAAPANAPAPAPAPNKTSTSRTGDGNVVNPYVDTKGKPRPDAPRGGTSVASKLIDAAPGVAKDVANNVNEKLNNAELRYLKDKIDRKETLSATDRVRAQRAGLL